MMLGWDTNAADLLLDSTFLTGSQWINHFFYIQPEVDRIRIWPVDLTCCHVLLCKQVGSCDRLLYYRCHRLL